jgi:hypothetical protein
MKIIATASTAFLAAILRFTAPAHAGQQPPTSESQDHTKPQERSRQAERPQQTGPDQSGPKRQPSQPLALQEKEKRPHVQHPEEQHAQQSRPEQTRPQRRSPRQPSQRVDRVPQTPSERQGALRTAWQQHRAGNWITDHRTWQQRGGYRGYRIPDRLFNGGFGRDHGFRIHGLPLTFADGIPRFQYDRYWFRIVDPWPEYWGDDWYDTDEVYVNYVGDGYYLFDDRYPSVGIAVSISM